MRILCHRPRSSFSGMIVRTSFPKVHYWYRYVLSLSTAMALVEKLKRRIELVDLVKLAHDNLAKVGQVPVRRQIAAPSILAPAVDRHISATLVTI